MNGYFCSVSLKPGIVPTVGFTVASCPVYLRREPQPLRRLVVDPHRRLLRQPLVVGCRVLVVVVQTLRVRLRPELEDVQADRIQPVLRNPAEHAAVLEAAGGVGGGAGQAGRGVANQVEQRAGVVGALREVAVALERRRHPEAADRRRPSCAADTRGVEEEQLVGAAGLADRPADACSPSRAAWRRPSDRRSAGSPSCSRSSRSCARRRRTIRGTGWCRSWSPR